MDTTNTARYHLTPLEAKLLEGSLRDDGAAAQGRSRWTSFALAFTGIAVLVGTSLDSPDQLRKTISFCFVVFALMLSLWTGHRDRILARSTIAKILTSTQCPHCGNSLVEISQEDAKTDRVGK
ncbi:MAG: hypothetical protein AMXMBFR22_31600 [Phycisphaerae bacterium]|jgi:hypothetical protein